MVQYKGFDSAACADNMAQFEVLVNDWLRQHHLHIRLMTQSARGEHVVVSFLYEDGADTQRPTARASMSPEMFDSQDDDEEYGVETPDDGGLPEAELPY
jgi:hypothetical protein